MSGLIGIPVLPWENLSGPCQDATFCTSREEARSQVVTRLIDLFVDIAVATTEEVAIGLQILRYLATHLPHRTPAELLDTCAMLPLE